MKTQQTAEALKNEIAKVFIGKEKQIELIAMAIFAGGHVLLDDLPGSGKTTLIKVMSKALGCDHKRIQFTPDLLPSDIIGMTVYDKDAGSFKHIRGPVFTNILLADEINRAIPRTQSALLEAMEENQVSIDNESFLLPQPFFVMATQNPVERESTFRLPVAQMDRFFIKLSLGFPDRTEELSMLSKHGDIKDLSPVSEISDPARLLEIREEINAVYVSDAVRRYIVELVQRTRESSDLEAGASPRASLSLLRGGRSLAAMNGRDYVTPEDIASIYIPVTAHRVSISAAARYVRKDAESILQAILKETPVPPAGAEMFDESGTQ